MTLAAEAGVNFKVKPACVVAFLGLRNSESSPELTGSAFWGIMNGTTKLHRLFHAQKMEQTLLKILSKALGLVLLSETRQTASMNRSKTMISASCF